MLYELATGHHPWSGAGMSEITTRILVTEPKRIGTLNPQVSAFFEELVHRLLAKSPEGRFASAGEVLAILTEGERSEWWSERSNALRETGTRPLRRMRVPRETEIHGREEPLAALGDAYRRAVEGEGQVVLVQGEAGIGKSRLMDEIIARLHDEGEEPYTLFGSCPPVPTASATGAFSMAFREHFGESVLPGALEARLGDMPLLLPAFAALLRGEPPPEGRTPISGDAVHTLFVNLTTALARERPTILIIDDLHFASEEGRGLFALLGLAAAQARVLLIGTARRELDEEWVAEIERLPHGRRLHLDRLDVDEIGALLVECLGSETAARALANEVHRKSDGNPYFAFEIVRGLKETRRLVRNAKGAWSTAGLIGEIEIPSTVTELILARIGTLDPEDRDLLDAAACAGFEFDPRVLAGALGRPVVPVLRHLARIERGTRLIRSAGRRFQFDQLQVRATLYEALPPPLRTEYHAAFAETLLAAHADGPPDGAAAAELCSHLLRGDLGAKALPFLTGALSHLADTGRRGDAIELIDMALDPGDFLSEAERVRLLIRAAHYHGVLGHRAREGRAIEEAARRADALADLPLLLESRKRLVWHHWSLAEYEPARAAAQEALEFARRIGDRSQVAVAFGDAGGIGNETGDFEEALAAYEHQAEAGKELGDRTIEVIGIANAGLSLQYLGRYAEALQRFEESLEISHELESQLMNALAMLNLGRLEALLGDTAAAGTLLDDCLPLIRSLGERRPEGYTLHRLGEVAEQEGRPDDAESLYRAALSLRRTIRYPTGIAETLLGLGRLLIATGRTDEAGEVLAEAADLAGTLGLRGEGVLAACHLARLPEGDGSAARAALADGEEKMRIADRMEAHFALYRALGERGDLRAAADLADHLVEHAPPDRRDAMREGVPILRAIREERR
jgi:tetratricopeptide (TPR) repeat protein